MILEPAKADPVDPALRALFGLALGDALNSQSIGGVLRHGAVWQKRKLLEHHRLLVAAELAQVVCRHLQHVHPVDNDLAFGRLDQPVDVADQG